MRKERGRNGVETMPRHETELLPDHCAKDVVCLCCGNVLLGDDGFGPAVARRLNDGDSIPDWAIVIDAGTAIRELLFDIAVCEQRPRRIIVVDALDVDLVPGEVLEIAVDALPRVNDGTFSLHQAPTSNLLRDLRDEANVEVTVVACQVEFVPEEVSEGLSPTVEQAVDWATDLIADKYLRTRPGQGDTAER